MNKKSMSYPKRVFISQFLLGSGATLVTLLALFISIKANGDRQWGSLITLYIYIKFIFDRWLVYIEDSRKIKRIEHKQNISN